MTRLSIMKVHPRMAMELARHSDIKLTMKNYIDVDSSRQAQSWTRCRVLVKT